MYPPSSSMYRNKRNNGNFLCSFMTFIHVNLKWHKFIPLLFGQWLSNAFLTLNCLILYGTPTTKTSLLEEVVFKKNKRFKFLVWTKLSYCTSDWDNLAQLWLRWWLLTLCVVCTFKEFVKSTNKLNKFKPWFAWLLTECTPPGKTLHKHFRSSVFTNMKLYIKEWQLNS